MVEARKTIGGAIIAPMFDPAAQPERAVDQARSTPVDQIVPAPHAPNNSTRQSSPGATTPAADVPALAIPVVQQDAWERPWNGAAAPSPDQTRDVGDRVRIQQGRRPIPALVGRVGTVVEVFRAPRDSCLVRMDGDPDRQREWFCYHDEVAASDQ